MLAYVHHLSPFIFEFSPGVGLRWYGMAYVLAFLLGYQLYYRLAKAGYTQMPPAQVSDFITWAAVFGVMLGGRVGWILFYGFKENHADDPWWWPLEVWKGGMSSHGGILGLVLFTFYWARRHKLSWTSIGDSLCVVAPVGLFVVRCANFINGELFGHETKVPWAVQFPTELFDSRFSAVTSRAFDALEPLQAVVEKYGGEHASWSERIVEAARHEPQVRAILANVLTPRHPSQIYEALLEGVLLFLILWLVRTKCRVPRGVLTGLFFILYAVFRIAGEVFRVPDPAWAVGSFSAGQFLSLFMLLIGAAFIGWGMWSRRYESALELKSPGSGNS
ncbi:MAG: Prolipoprotein diacylglyceryl transferase [Chthoniobacteraceae bacterium]|nr:Prolipoprotein diacylglyceryl transferase [Chthoniobacteraceae bacterium]